MAPSPGTWILGGARALLAACEPRVLNRDFAASDRFTADGYAERVVCPTLVVTGGRDRMTPAAKGVELAAKIPGARCVELSRAGHFVMTEEPRELLRLMRAFLEESRETAA